MKAEFLQNFKAGDAPLPQEAVEAILAENARDLEAAESAEGIGEGVGMDVGGIAVPVPDLSERPEPEDPPFASWGEAFRFFLDLMLDGVPKLKMAFGDFAAWLNDFSKKVYGMFTFPGVLERVQRLSRALAALVNGAVSEIAWHAFGAWTWSWELDERNVFQPYTIPAYPVGEYTRRDALMDIAAAHGGNWTVTDAGRLRLVPLLSFPPETHYLVTQHGEAILFGGTKILLKA